MNNTRFQIAVYKEAKRLGIKPSNLSDAQLVKISMLARPVAELVKDGAKLGKSVVGVYLGDRRVPLPVYQERRAGCLSNRCGRAGVSAEGNPFCLVCGCVGATMDTALWDATETCRLPPGQRIWEAYVANRT